MPNNYVRGVLYACLSACSYGTNPIFAKFLYQDGINTNSVLFYRFAFGTLLLGLLMLAERRTFSLTRREAAILLALGVIFAISSITYFLSFYYMPAGVAATLVFSYPVFVALLMAIFYHERLKWPSLMAIALTIGGMVLLNRNDDGQPIALTGILLILGSALSYAFYIIIVNKSKIALSSVKLTFFAMISCLMTIIVYAMLTPAEPLQLLHGESEWTYAFMLGLLPTVVSLVFMAMAIRCIGSTPTAIMGALEPVTAILLGVLFLSEALSVRSYFGIALILVAVTLIILDDRLRRALKGGRILKKGRLMWHRIRWK